MRANDPWNLNSAACASLSFARMAGSYKVTRSIATFIINR